MRGLSLQKAWQAYRKWKRQPVGKYKYLSCLEQSHGKNEGEERNKEVNKSLNREDGDMEQLRLPGIQLVHLASFLRECPGGRLMVNLFILTRIHIYIQIEGVVYLIPRHYLFTLLR